MKSKQELDQEFKSLEARFENLASLEQKIQIPIKISLPNGVKVNKTLEIDLILDWQDGLKGSCWLQDSNRKDQGCLDLEDIENEISEQYNTAINKFVDDCVEFEKNGGEFPWW